MSHLLNTGQMSQTFTYYSSSTIVSLEDQNKPDVVSSPPQNYSLLFSLSFQATPYHLSEPTMYNMPHKNAQSLSLYSKSHVNFQYTIYEFTLCSCV